MNYVECGYCKAWIMWDLDNGHESDKNDSGKGYMWVFPTYKEALEHRRKQHKYVSGARLSKPVKIT